MATSGVLSAIHSWSGLYPSKRGFQSGSSCKPRSWAAPMEGTCEVARPQTMRAIYLFPPFLSMVLNSSVDIPVRSEEHTSELQSRFDLVCRLLLEKKKITYIY